MKLYYAPGACSLASHIALHEAGTEFEREQVNLKTKETETGEDFMRVNPKGYVPALTFDNGETLTENVAILEWISQQHPKLVPDGELGRSRLLEMLAFISTEIHKSFKPFFSGASDEDKAAATEQLGKRFQLLARNLHGDYLFGDVITPADAYLFVMLMWADKMDIAVPGGLDAFRQRMMEREAVKLALEHEGLTEAA